jgi:hypothetical protein
MRIDTILVTSALLLSFNIANANHHEGGHEGCNNMKSTEINMKGMDTTKDGAISSAEYLAITKEKTADNFKHMDANNDGKLDTMEQKDIEAVLNEMRSKPAKAPVSTM